MAKRYSDEELQQIEQDFRSLIEERKIAYLLADASIASRKIIQNALEKAGGENILEAKKAKEALQVLEKLPEGTRPIILSDLSFPDQPDILKFIAAIRAMTKLKEPTILLMAQDIQKPVLAAVLKAGAAGFFKKPVPPETLLSKLKELNAI